MSLLSLPPLFPFPKEKIVEHMHPCGKETKEKRKSFFCLVHKEKKEKRPTSFPLMLGEELYLFPLPRSREEPFSFVSPVKENRLPPSSLVGKERRSKRKRVFFRSSQREREKGKKNNLLGQLTRKSRREGRRGEGVAHCPYGLGRKKGEGLRDSSECHPAHRESRKKRDIQISRSGIERTERKEGSLWVCLGAPRAPVAKEKGGVKRKKTYCDREVPCAEASIRTRKRREEREGIVPWFTEPVGD